MKIDKFETNRSVYNKQRKYFLSQMYISCAICKYHKGENASKSQRNWKTKRKQKHRVIKDL